MAETRPELLDGAVAVRLIKGQLDLRAATVQNVHVGGCMSMICATLPDGTVIAGYEPNDCDCPGPEMAAAHVEFGRGLVELWRQASWDERLPLAVVVDLLMTSLMPLRGTCWRCRGRGTWPLEGTTVCRICDGVGTKVRTEKEDADEVGER